MPLKQFAPQGNWLAALAAAVTSLAIHFYSYWAHPAKVGPLSAVLLSVMSASGVFVSTWLALHMRRRARSSLSGMWDRIVANLGVVSALCFFALPLWLWL